MRLLHQRTFHMLVWIFLGIMSGFIARGFASVYLVWRSARACYFRYWPWLEIIGGGAALLLRWRFEDAIALYLALWTWSLSACLIDMAISELPDVLTLGGLVFGLPLAVAAGFSSEDYILGAVGGAGAYYLANVATKQAVFGAGDVKFAAFLGGMVGIEKLPWFLAGSMGGLALLMLLLNLAQKRRPANIPFAPVMAAAYWGAVLL